MITGLASVLLTLVKIGIALALLVLAATKN